MIAWCSCLAVSLLLPGSTGPRDSAKLVFTVQPVATAPGAPIRPAVQVTAQDEDGETLTEFTGAVTLSISEGTGDEDATLSGTLTVSAVAGVATFTDLRIDKEGTGYTLTTAASGFAAAMSALSTSREAAAEAAAEPSRQRPRRRAPRPQPTPQRKHNPC